MKKWNIVIVAAAVSVLLGGCAMGGATGDKTTQGVQALESGDYTQAQQLFTEALQSGEQEMLAYRGLGPVSYTHLIHVKRQISYATSFFKNKKDRKP